MREIKTVDKLFYRQLGSFIRNKRIEKGLSQRDLGKMIGVSHSLMGYYEDGQSKLNENTYKRICDALGIYKELKINIEI